MRVRAGFVLGVLAVTVLGGCRKRGPALPEPLGMREWAVPWANSFPSDVVVDDAGRLWFTDRLVHVIGRFDPETEQFESYRTPTAKSAPYGLVRGPEGGLWFAESQAGKLGRIDAETGVIEEYSVADTLRGGPHLVAVSGGEIWFTMREGRGFGALDPVRGEVRLFRTPVVSRGRSVPAGQEDRYRAEPYGIAAGPDGTIWIGVMGGWVLYEVDARTGALREHDLSEPAPDSLVERLTRSRPDSLRGRIAASLRRSGAARRLAVDARGRVWITDFARSRVVRYDPTSGRLDSFDSFRQPSEPYGIAVAPDGVVWYSEKRNDLLVALNPETGERLRLAVTAPGATVRHLAVDAKRGRVWLPLSDRGRIGMLEIAR